MKDWTSLRRVRIGRFERREAGAREKDTEGGRSPADMLVGDPGDTVASLKQRIKQINKMEPSDQRLVQIDDRHVLEDDKTLRECKIEDTATLGLILRKPDEVLDCQKPYLKDLIFLSPTSGRSLIYRSLRKTRRVRMLDRNALYLVNQSKDVSMDCVCSKQSSSKQTTLNYLSLVAVPSFRLGFVRKLSLDNGVQQHSKNGSGRSGASC
eukprot:763914-Hanusia_phi.AAC.5